MRKTKILVTLGPSAESEEVLEQLLTAGMNVARLNFSHGDYLEHGTRVERIKKIREKIGRPIALMLDTKGPEIRAGNVQNDSLILETGREIILTSEDVEGTSERLTIRYDQLAKAVKPGGLILLDDGLLQFEVIEVLNDKEVRCFIQSGGRIKSRRNVHLPKLHLELPNPTPKDIADLKFAAANQFDFIAVSFAESAQTVSKVRQILDENSGSGIRIIAKIENYAGLDNFDEILASADGIMVARGDLGVELPAEDVPVVQKELIRKCYMAGKPVITATQMLHSMVENPRPTRAEASDVANAIYDFSSAVMLSGETSVGKFPTQCVEFMTKAAERAEQAIDYRKIYFSNPAHRENLEDTTFAITNAAVTTAYNVGAKAIITVTESGHTARMLSRLRPAIPIIALTHEPQVYHQLSINWGVLPVSAPHFRTLDELHHEVIKLAKETGLVKNGDTVILVAGIPVGKTGATNMIKVEVVDGVTRSIKAGEPPKFVKSQSLKEKFAKSEQEIIPISKNDRNSIPFPRHSQVTLDASFIDRSNEFDIDKNLLFRPHNYR
ncbi:MAG: pyruvate kinase [Candidatus Riflebacteria bacterium]|nr:pyruvate kinase [Candidatus Riflebacteria bacterium]